MNPRTKLEKIGPSCSLSLVRANLRKGRAWSPVQCAMASPIGLP